MSSQAPEEEDSYEPPRRDPAVVIADYLNEFGGGDQAAEYEHPDPQVLIRWLRDEGWEITPISA